MKMGGVRTPMPTMSNPKFQFDLSPSHINILKNGSAPTASPRKGGRGGGEGVQTMTTLEKHLF